MDPLKTQLVNYVKYYLERGSDRQQLYSSLLQAGWDQTSVDWAFRSVDAQMAIMMPASPTTPTTKTAVVSTGSKPFKNKLFIILPVIIILMIGLLFLPSPKPKSNNNPPNTSSDNVVNENSDNLNNPSATGQNGDSENQDNQNTNKSQLPLVDQRKQLLSSLKDEIDNYFINYGQTYPSDANALSSYLSSDVSGNFIDKLIDPQTKKTYKLVDQIPQAGEIQYVRYGICLNDKIAEDPDASHVAIALLLDDKRSHCDYI